jgi:hypothetical protein
MSCESQVLSYLLSGKELTVVKAFRLFHTTELRRIISRLRKSIPIQSEMVTNYVTNKRYAEYWINKNQINALKEEL